MKMKIMMASVIGLTLGLSAVAMAATSSYFPPERINCQLGQNGKLFCNEFNRQYLAENATNAELEQGRDDAFNFYSAYFDNNLAEASVFFTYKDSQSHTVKLKTINPMIRPDFKNGNWKKLNKDLYICNAGYMSCPITNLPQS